MVTENLIVFIIYISYCSLGNKRFIYIYSFICVAVIVYMLKVLSTLNFLSLTLRLIYHYDLIFLISLRNFSLCLLQLLEMVFCKE